MSRQDVAKLSEAELRWMMLSHLDSYKLTGDSSFRESLDVLDDEWIARAMAANKGGASDEQQTLPS